MPSDDPLERKLYYKLNAQKRKATKIAEELAPAARDDDDDEDNLDSRTSAFEKKKRAADPVTPSIGKKKRRK